MDAKKNTKVVVVFYSLYTHAWTVAEAIAEGFVFQYART